MLRSFLRYHLSALAWAASILWLLLLSEPSGGGTEAQVTRFVLSLSSFWTDLTYHIVAFGALGLLAARSFARFPSVRAVRAAVVGSALYGAALESAQNFIPDRAFEPWDLLSNAAGAALGGWVWARFDRGSGRRE